MYSNIPYNYSTVIDANSEYDFDKCGELLLKNLANDDKLSLEQRIKIIQDFQKFQPGEEYGGGEPCTNTDCYRQFTSDYFIEIKGKDYISKKINGKWCKIIEQVSVYYCPSCIEGFEYDCIFPIIVDDV